jgi:hypothetical protein
VDPANFRRLWSYDKAAVEQALVEAVARSKKHLMLTKPDWSAIAINRAVMDSVKGHRICSGP